MPPPTKSNFDMIIIGAGIHGLMTALLAAERGYRPVLLDKSDPGQATSNGWFGILHGGLRYLKSLDLPRYQTALRDRRWFMENAPDAIKPLPFLMPLYGRGLKRRSVFRLAFLLDAVLSSDRNRDVTKDLQLGLGQILKPQAVEEAFPSVRRSGLEGGALWQEAIVPDLSALFDVLLEKAQHAGIVIKSQYTVDVLLVEDGCAIGVQCTPDKVEIHAPIIFNCAGPWAESLAGQLVSGHQPKTGLKLAFNLIVNRPAPSPYGVSIMPPNSNQEMLFLYPEGETRTRIGTWYEDLNGSLNDPTPTDQAIADFITAVNESLPEFTLSADDISEVTKGVLPTRSPKSKELLNKPLIVDHASHGGPTGFFTIIGNKYTTANNTARLALDRAKASHRK